MNTEVWDYLKNLSKKEYFAINLIDSILGVAIIVMGFVALNSGVTMQTYAIMFLCGAVMLILNAYKGFKRKNGNRWIFLFIGICFAAISGLFFAAWVLSPI